MLSKLVSCVLEDSLLLAAAGLARVSAARCVLGKLGCLALSGIESRGSRHMT